MITRKVQFDFYNAPGTVLLGSLTTSADSKSLLLSNAELIAILGSEMSFQLRARLVTDSDWWQVESEDNTLNVTKI